MSVRLIAVIALVLVFAFWWNKMHSPEHTLYVINSISTAEQVEAASDYLTPTGKKLLLYAVIHSESATSSQVVLISKKKDSGSCVFQMSEKEGDGSEYISNIIILYVDGRWKFDDVFLVSWKSVDGGPINVGLMASFIMEHPYESAAIVVAKNPSVILELVKKFIEGWKIGQAVAAIVTAL